MVDLVGVPAVVVFVVVRISTRCHVKGLGPLDPSALGLDGVPPVAVGSLRLLEDVDQLLPLDGVSGRGNAMRV
jgi:hypothetical protein